MLKGCYNERQQQREACLDGYEAAHSSLVYKNRVYDSSPCPARDRIIAQQEVEQAESKYTSTAKELAAAKFRVQAATADVEREQAGLVSLEA